MKRSKIGSTDGEETARTGKSRSNGFMKFLLTLVGRIFFGSFTLLDGIK
jgi:hypothetical protein